MNNINHVLKMLKKSKYIEYTNVYNSISEIKLLKYGKVLCENLIQEWMINKGAVDRSYVAEAINRFQSFERHSFIKTNDFRINLIKTKKASLQQCPLVIKQRINLIGTLRNGENIMKFSKTQQQTRLISDYFFNCFCGLEIFYYIQRQRKIWWMIHLCNPSCFYIDPCDKNEYEGAHVVKIKSMLPLKNIDIENISYVSIKDCDPANSKCFHFDELTGQHITVVRSVINLESAACALLLDACTNIRKETLFLHSKLVPYQCAVIGICDELHVSELKDLHRHISDVIRNGGIKIFAQNCTKNIGGRLTVESKFKTFDQIGIPYVIILEDQSLKNGLLKLRSRDTLLQETIHISDIPGYLKQILNC